MWIPQPVKSSKLSSKPYWTPDKGSIVKSWCEFARDDPVAAKYLLGLHPLKLEVVCYHWQQSAEEYFSRVFNLSAGVIR